MSRNTMLGVIGGVLIAISVFFSGNSANFNLDKLSGGQNIVLFAAGVLVVIFMVIGNRTWAGFATIAATTILLVHVLDGGFKLDLAFVLLTVGVILGLIASVFGKK